MRFALVCAVAVAAAAGSPAEALLIVGDLVPGSADGLLTHDTETRLQWLDLTASIGLSFEQVSQELDSGGEFAGFRYATNEEIAELWTHAGIPDINLPGYLNFTEANYAPALALVSLVGATEAILPQQTVARGISATTDPLDPEYHYTPQIDVEEAALPFTAEARSNGIILASYGNGVTGSWLVREVPEPANGLLVVIGLVTLGGVRRPTRARS